MAGRGRPSRASVYRRLEHAIEELNSRLGGLPSPKEAESIWRDIWYEEAHHSTAIEGNTLAIKEVQALLSEGRAVGAKPLREYLEVKGYGDAAQWVYGQAMEPDERHDGRLVTLDEVRMIHKMAMTPVWDVYPDPGATDREGPGYFREHEIQAFAAGMQPPTWPLVPSMAAGWVESACDLGNRAGQPGDGDQQALPEELARVHNEFEKVHPFLDGNGRVGRLALNLLLVRLGYPPVIILKRQRPAYLAAMHRADQGDYGALGELIARAMYDNLNRFIVPNLAGPARLVPLAALQDDRISQQALRQAAQRGRLDAVQGSDSVWRSSKKAVDAYLASRNAKAPKR
ncbi:Fic family protein [Longispora albida]|uniref:Fic family protein n=1 Tax=Longispora albida TaxID=203523 RepID=UPI00037F5AF1|nr:Fic family protein [Longispora albida]